MKIHRLSTLVANQIAAGEVIERPASVIKELLENSLDAGATRVDIEIEKGGLQLIRVSDNGCGIAKEDLPLALESHATSKIQSIDDIHSVTSLGFRGEALASIASIARVTLRSREAESPSAWQISVAGRSGDVEVKPASGPVGTCMTVNDIFFNTPARRKFLRTERTEFEHIQDVVRRIALSHFNIAVTLKHNDKVIFSLRPAESEAAGRLRVAKVLGNAFLDHALAIDFGASGLSLSGWVGLPEAARSDITGQYCFINGRMVRDKLINHAIRGAYGDLLGTGKHPAYVLHLTIPPDLVDVNVHPTKHEVRFVDGRLLHDFIFRSLTNALARCEAEHDDNVTPIASVTIKPEPRHTAGVAPQTRQPLFPKPGSRANIQSQLSGYAACHPRKSEFVKRRAADSQLGKVIGQVQERYLLTENANGLVIVDLTQARRAVAYHYLQRAFAAADVKTMPLLIPVTVQLDEEAVATLDTEIVELARLGFEIVPSSPTSVTVRSVPVVLADADHERVVAALITFVDSASQDEQALVTALADAIQTHQNMLSHNDIEELLVQLEALQEDKVNTYREFSLTEIEALVGSKST